jgi:Leucine-rich repeat (LRR) protein
VGTPTTGTNLLNLITDAFPESEEALQDLNSPQSQALVWLESSDNNGVSSEEQLLQRYALAVLYYASIGDEWTNNDSWLTSADECSWWSNVNTQDMCDSLGRYVAVDLAGNNLQGSIPPELAILSNSLSIVSMSSNELGGELPSALFDMTNLRQLTLFENRLVGSLSSHVGQLTRLESLDVGGNQLTGTLPSSLGQMQRLAGLSVYGNSFTGVIPSSLGDLDSLQLLYADSNNLRGPFPTDLCLLNLREFWSDCEETQCVCCTTCCNDGFGCVET